MDLELSKQVKVDCLVAFYGKYFQEGKYYPFDFDIGNGILDDEPTPQSVFEHDLQKFGDSIVAVPSGGLCHDERMCKALKSAWSITNYITIPFDDRKQSSGVRYDIDSCGFHDFVKEYEEDIFELFEKRKDENFDSYVVLAFSYSSYRDYFDEWNSESQIIGEFDFKTGTIIKITD